MFGLLGFDSQCQAVSVTEVNAEGKDEKNHFNMFLL